MLVLLTALSFGCAPDVPRERDGSDVQEAVTTDRSAYRLVDGKALIDVHFANLTSRVVYLTHCGSEPLVVFERRSAWTGTSNYPLLCSREGRAAVAVAPGESMTIPLTLRTRLPGPLTVAELTGTYRARVPIYTAVDAYGFANDRQPPDDTLTSRTFTVTR